MNLSDPTGMEPTQMQAWGRESYGQMMYPRDLSTIGSWTAPAPPTKPSTIDAAQQVAASSPEAPSIAAAEVSNSDWELALGAEIGRELQELIASATDRPTIPGPSAMAPIPVATSMPEDAMWAWPAELNAATSLWNVNHDFHTDGPASVAPWCGVQKHHKEDGSLKFHQGWDVTAPKGSAIFAAQAGTIESAQGVGGGGQLGPIGAIVVRHLDGGATRYMHVSVDGVSVGQSVSRGEGIAFSNSSGTDGAHLHFEAFLPFAAITSGNGIRLDGLFPPWIPKGNLRP